MDLTVLNLALPSLSAALKPSSVELLWIVDIYGFMVAGSLITMGVLGDRIGRRKLLLIGAASFCAASVFAAFSTHAAMLIFARAILGVAGATLAPSTLSLIRNMFHDPKQRTVAVSVWIMSYSIGAAIGPLIGGMLLEHFWWGSVFLINVPVMALLLVLGPLLLPEFREPTGSQLDVLSAVESVAAVLFIIYGLKLTVQSGPGWLSAAAILFGLSIGAAFVRRQRRLADPLIDLSLFRLPAFSAGIATNIFGFLIGFGIFIFIAQYQQLVLGLSPLQAGAWSLPAALAFILGSLLTPSVARRFSPANVISGGMVLSALGYIILATVHGSPFPLALLVGGSVVYSIGLTPVVILATDMVLGAVPPERAGRASVMSETSSEFGGALGVALLGCIGIAIYRGSMAHALPPDASKQIAEAALGTLGGAVAAASYLPSPVAIALLADAREAFGKAFEAVAIVSATIAITLAVLARIVLRDVTRPSGAAHVTVPTMDFFVPASDRRAIYLGVPKGLWDYITGVFVNRAKQDTSAVERYFARRYKHVSAFDVVDVTSGAYEEALRLVANHCSPLARQIFDLGCGSGKARSLAMSRGISYVGIDLALAESTDNQEGDVKLIRHDLSTPLPKLEIQHPTLLLAIHTLCYLEEPTVLFGQLERYLCDGDTLIVIDPEASLLWERSFHGINVFFRSKAELIGILEKLGWHHQSSAVIRLSERLPNSVGVLSNILVFKR